MNNQLDSIINKLLSNSVNDKINNLERYKIGEWTDSIFSVTVNKEVIQQLLQDNNNISDFIKKEQINKCMGALLGLVVADGIGHNYEFLPVRDTVPQTVSNSENKIPLFEHIPVTNEDGSVTMRSILHNPYNKFRLKEGQWTDDASMALCLADSILSCGKYDGSNTRKWYWNWWCNGVNNAFLHDNDRYNGKRSVGLGGNIAMSIQEVDQYSTFYINSNLNNTNKKQLNKEDLPPNFERDNEDAGNGSLMRLAPIALRYHNDINTAREMAFNSSLATHPGKQAAEACSFLAHLLVRAIHYNDEDCSNKKTDNGDKAKLFLDTIRDEYLLLLHEKLNVLNDKMKALQQQQLELQAANNSTIFGYISNVFNVNNSSNIMNAITADINNAISHKEAIQKLIRLLLSEESDQSLERCWNWRSSTLDITGTLERRGRSYNGYPVSAEYFGSYCFDGLAIALHSVYTTNSFNDAIVKVVNYLGDADTTGAICGQIAGSIYGVNCIDEKWQSDVQKWDPNNEIKFRALLLYHVSYFNN